MIKTKFITNKFGCTHELENDEDYCSECQIYHQRYKELFHVFTDGEDEWVATKKEAMLIAKDILKEDKTANVRIYHETEWDENNGIFDDGECIYSKGEYPY